jgi:ribosomal-protein-alanine N-acetyltransferase
MSRGDTAASPVVETARLRLRLVHERDAPAAAHLMTPAVSQWLASWPSPLDEPGAAARLRRMRDATVQGQALCFAIEGRNDGALMGLVMVVRTKYDARRGDLGYWLGEPFHRRGYMAEAAAAAVAEAFIRLDLDAIEAGAQPANEASLAIMRRLGMRPIDERPVWAETRGREERCAYYEITRHEHAARRA